MESFQNWTFGFQFVSQTCGSMICGSGISAKLDCTRRRFFQQSSVAKKDDKERWLDMDRINKGTQNSSRQSCQHHFNWKKTWTNNRLGFLYACCMSARYLSPLLSTRTTYLITTLHSLSYLFPYKQIYSVLHHYLNSLDGNTSLTPKVLFILPFKVIRFSLSPFHPCPFAYHGTPPAAILSYRRVLCLCQLICLFSFL